METHTLSAQLRTVMGRATQALRDQSLIPGVVYGNAREPQNVAVDRVAFIKTYREAGNSGLVNLSLGEETIPVLIQDFQQHPVSDFVTHIDFKAVDLLKEVDAELRLHFIGEAPAVKALSGTLITSIDEISVTALPTALVSHIDVDVSVLATFDDMIHVRDLVLPEGIRVSNEDDLESVIATVSAPRSEAEMASLDEAVVEDVAAVEGAVEPKEGEEEDKNEDKNEKGGDDADKAE